MSPQSLATWSDFLSEEKNKPYFIALLKEIHRQRAQGKQIFPCQSDVFNAFKYTPIADLKVVIIGQDPYHGPGQAHGLSFSVPPGVTVPPSLRNIYKEIQSDLSINTSRRSGCLKSWAEQGVLLLNATLTVESRRPQSHAQLGWQTFTDAVVRAINTLDQPVVFLLWGSHAQKKCQNLNNSKHKILKSTHPSPLSAHRGFIGCQHFSKTNRWLSEQGVKEISW
jgi:uracil-DNA glycosylase